MAFPTGLSRLSSRLRPMALKLNKASVSADSAMASQSHSCASVKRISRTARLPVELSCLESMMPLHSAIASARLRSGLSIEAKCWGVIPQGLSMPL